MRHLPQVLRHEARFSNQFSNVSLGVRSASYSKPIRPDLWRPSDGGLTGERGGNHLRSSRHSRHRQISVPTVVGRLALVSILRSALVPFLLHRVSTSWKILAISLF